MSAMSGYNYFEVDLMGDKCLMVTANTKPWYFWPKQDVGNLAVLHLPDRRWRSSSWGRCRRTMRSRGGSLRPWRSRRRWPLGRRRRQRCRKSRLIKISDARHLVKKSKQPFWRQFFSCFASVAVRRTEEENFYQRRKPIFFRVIALEKEWKRVNLTNSRDRERERERGREIPDAIDRK